LKLNHDQFCAFNFNLRRFTLAKTVAELQHEGGEQADEQMFSAEAAKGRDAAATEDGDGDAALQFENIAGVRLYHGRG
jgi:hypothetical protein